MTTILGLPLEIDAQIINLLEVESLKAYSLVCKAYLPLCRRRLFARVLLFNSRFSVEEEIARMQQLLAASPAIPEFIEELDCNTSPLLRNDDSHVGTALQGHVDVLQKFLQRISNLQSFRVIGTPFRPLDWSTTKLRPQFTHILSLPTLECLTIEWADNFVSSDLLHCGPGLKQLHVERFSMASRTSNVVENKQSRSLKLAELTSGVGLTKCLSRLCAPYTTGGNAILDLALLSRCHITLNECQDKEIARQILQHSSRLVDIRLTWCRYQPPILEFSAILSPFLLGLKHIRLQYQVLPAGTSQDPVRGIAAELENIRRDNVLESLAIDVHVSDYCSTGDLWGGLGKVLTRPGWTALQKVSLELYLYYEVQDSTPFVEELRDLPRTQFSRLSASKSITFDFCIVEV